MKTRTQSDVSQSTDNKEESWGKGDSSWWGKGQRSSSTRRSSSSAPLGKGQRSSWSNSRGGSWDYTNYSHADGGYHNSQYWVKKENKTEDESPPEALADAESWPTVWVKKKGVSKNEEGSQQEQGGDGNDGIAKDPNDEKENRREETEVEVRKPSWADKVKGIKEVDESHGKASNATVIASPSSSPLAKAKSKLDSSLSPMAKKMSYDSSMSPMTKTLSNHAPTANQGIKTNSQIAPAPGLEAEIKTPEAESKTSGTPTWADRMRKSSQ